jgi:hypothetical protein
MKYKKVARFFLYVVLICAWPVLGFLATAALNIEGALAGRGEFLRFQKRRAKWERAEASTVAWACWVTTPRQRRHIRRKVDEILR